MNRIVNMLRRLWRWLRSRKELQLEPVCELPDSLADGVGYVVGEQGHEWHVVMACPCGCGSSIYLNLLPDDRPRWELIRHADKTFSLYPSVWRTSGCRSHFFVRRSRIECCGNSARH